jgi:enolase
MDAGDQAALDRRLIDLDGTEDKSRLGANALLGVSCAVARAVAAARGEPLWQSLRRMADGIEPSMPVPMVNILSGGLHAGKNLEFQDFLVIAHGFRTYAEALAAVVAIHAEARKVLEERGCLLTGVADEGGWGPRLHSNEEALQALIEAIVRAGYHPGQQVSIALDVASSHFFTGDRYDLRSEDRSLSSGEMVDLLAHWVGSYPIRSIEDGLDQDDWDGWRRLTAKLGATVQLVGDDLFTTKTSRLQRGIDSGAANAVLVKMNQVGTLIETFDILRLARSAGYRAVVSARSGETEDSFLADLAVASGAGQIKVGSITRSERLAKYNRLLRIEADARLPYSSSIFT